MTAAVETRRESLQETMARLRTSLNSGRTGPLLVAEEIERISKDWAAVKDAEAGGLSCTAFLKTVLGDSYDLDFFVKRAKAVRHLGEASRRILAHDAAIWVANHLSGQDDVKKAMFALSRRYQDNRKNALSLAQASLVVAKTFEEKRKPRVQSSEPVACLECARKDVEIAELKKRLAARE